MIELTLIPIVALFPLDPANQGFLGQNVKIKPPSCAGFYRRFHKLKNKQRDSGSFEPVTESTTSLDSTSLSSSSRSSAMPQPEKCMSNYIYDNPDLKESNYKKTSACGEMLDNSDSDVETWILQCPKGFDPNTIVNKQLGMVSKDGKIEISSNRFTESIALACLTPGKETEYKSVCDDVKIVRPVGKIFVTENATSQSVEDAAAIDDEDVTLYSSEHSSSSSVKKIENLRDQRLTIETTVIVENYPSAGDRVKNKKSKDSSDSSSPQKKKKMKKIES
jgi:hypothetical protein